MVVLLSCYYCSLYRIYSKTAKLKKAAALFEMASVKKVVKSKWAAKNSSGGVS